jgi:hypothetical protein
MRIELSESMVELVAIALTALGSAVLALAGLAVELAAVADLSAGQPTIGVWELVLGALLLYAGCYLLGYQRVVPAFRDRSGT